MISLHGWSRSNWKRATINAALCLGALVATACSDSVPNNEEPGASVQFVVPSESISDWLSFAKHIAVVRVVREEQMPVAPEVTARGEGHVPGIITLQVERIIWTAPGAAPASGELHVGSLGWTMHDGKLRAINPDLKVGGTYLVAFANFRSGLAPLRPISLAIVDGEVVSAGKTARSSSGEWVGSLDGLSVDDVQKLLATTPPDALAIRFRNLAVEEQIEAVHRAKTATP